MEKPTGIHVGLLGIDENCVQRLMNPKSINDVYIVEQTPFARGKFAAVRKCRHRVTGIEYAAKFIRKRRRQQDARHEILHEAAVLVAAEECPRIVSLHEIFENNIEMVLVLELAAGGELQRLVDLEEGLGEHETIRLLRQILVGLDFLHKRNIAHLDIKPQNILLTDISSSSDIKLCDFGISRVIQEGVEVREILGTPDYVAPEILSYDPISLGTDIWSIGVLAYVLLTGCSPFGGDTKQDTYCNISQCELTFPEELFEGISTSAQDFISRALVKKPSNRMTVEECLLHPWLNYNNSVSLFNQPHLNCSTFPSTCISCSSQSQTVCCEKVKTETQRQTDPEMISHLNHHHVDLLLDRSIIC